VALIVALGSPGSAAAQTTTAAQSASQTAANQQTTLFEAFLFELMVDLAFEDYLAQGGSSPDEFLTFLEGTLGGLILPELAAAGTGQAVSFAGSDDPDVQFEEFLMEFFVTLAQQQFLAQGGGTPAQFQAFLQNSLMTVGTPQLTNVVKQVQAADAARGVTPTTTASTATTTGTTTTGTTTTSTTTTGTRTTGTTGTTTGTRTGTTGTTTTPGG
jgi:hypothetical protein